MPFSSSKATALRQVPQVPVQMRSIMGGSSSVAVAQRVYYASGLHHNRAGGEDRRRERGVAFDPDLFQSGLRRQRVVEQPPGGVGIGADRRRRIGGHSAEDVPSAFVPDQGPGISIPARDLEDDRRSLIR